MTPYGKLLPVAAGDAEYHDVHWGASKRCEEQGGSLQAADPDQSHLLQATHAEQTLTDR